MITISLANAIFLVCLLVGGVLLLVTVVLGDLVGGILDAFHMGVDVGEVSLTPLLLAFVSMFGVGGLFGTEVFGLGSGPASLLGAGTGLIGAGLVFVLFSFLRRAESPEPFSLTDLVGQPARVSVSIPAGRYGSVYLSYAGSTHNLTATAERDIPAGATVSVVGIAGSNLVVAPNPQSTTRGGNPDA